MRIMIISAPYSLDHADTGMGLAPAALIDAGLVSRLEALGCTVQLAEPARIAPSAEPRLTRIASLLGLLRDRVARARLAGAFPLVLGGDCLTSIGTVGGLLAPAETGVAWIDAHGDFNTPETTVSGYLGGMPLACLAGRGLPDLRDAVGLSPAVPEAQIALIGARDLDAAEADLLASTEVSLVRAEALRGGPRGLAPALGSLGELSQVYLHVDVDVLDTSVAPGVDYPAGGGLSLDELRDAVRLVAGMGNLAALGLTAVNPERDVDGQTVRAAIDVLEAAVAEAMSAEL